MQLLLGDLRDKVPKAQRGSLNAKHSEESKSLGEGYFYSNLKVVIKPKDL